MITYHEDIQSFEYREKDSNLFCFSLPQLIKQAQDIYGINLLTILN